MTEKTNEHPILGRLEPKFPFDAPEKDGLPPIFSLGDPLYQAWGAEMDRFYEENIVVDPELRTITLHFKYPYEIDLDRIKTERHLLKWCLHLCEKTWMTTARIKQFAERVARIKKLSIH